MRQLSLYQKAKVKSVMAADWWLDWSNPLIVLATFYPLEPVARIALDRAGYKHVRLSEQRVSEWHKTLVAGDETIF